MNLFNYKGSSIFSYKNLILLDFLFIIWLVWNFTIKYLLVITIYEPIIFLPISDDEGQLAPN